MTETQSNPAGQRSSMKKLYQMQRTAGVGLQDYAEVNGFAVAAAVLGVASLLAVALQDLRLLLLLPALGAIFGVVALVQIRKSSGTQTGTLVAIVGLLLSVGCAGYIGASDYQQSRRDAQSRQVVADMTREIGQLLVAGKFDEAYQKFDPRFRNRVSPEVFTGMMQRISDGTIFRRKLEGLQLGGRTLIERDSATGSEAAVAILMFDLTAPTEPNVRDIWPEETIQFSRSDGQWYVYDIPSLFPPAMRQAPGRGA